MKRYCHVCKRNEMCVIIANDEAGNPTVTVCHRCGNRIN